MAPAEGERGGCGGAAPLIVRAGLLIGGVSLLVIANAVKSDGCFNKDVEAEAAGFTCKHAKDNGTPARNRRRRRTVRQTTR